MVSQGFFLSINCLVGRSCCTLQHNCAATVIILLISESHATRFRYMKCWSFDSIHCMGTFCSIIWRFSDTHACLRKYMFSCLPTFRMQCFGPCKNFFFYNWIVLSIQPFIRTDLDNTYYLQTWPTFIVPKILFGRKVLSIHELN